MILLRNNNSGHRYTSRALMAGVIAVFVAAAMALLACAPGAVRSAVVPATSTSTVVHASRIAPASHLFLHPGAKVSQSALGVRLFVDAKHGFALANVMQSGQTTYPAATTDGGRSWRIDGPPLHVSAANAPNVVTQVGAAQPATYFAYGGPGGGNSVVVTADRGKNWWRAYLGGSVYAVVATTAGGHHKLVAFTNLPGYYYSVDSGRTWHHTHTVS